MDYSYPNRSTSTTRYSVGFIKTSTRGKSRDASFTLDVTVDGAPFDIEGMFGDESYKFGSLSKSTYSEITMYQVS
jgi:hypothetical protein